MVKTFKVGEHVSWSSQAGKGGQNYKGHIDYSTPIELQYGIKSDKTDHVALHKAGVLRRLG